MSRAGVLALLAMVGCSGTDGAGPLELRFLTADGDDPYLGATELLIAVEDGAAESVVEHYDIDELEATLPPVPFGSGLRFRVDVLGGDLVLARGRSFPFDATAEERPDTANVLVGRLGRFVVPTDDPLEDTPVAILPTDAGALVATRRGMLYEYRAHDPERSGRASIARVGDNPQLVNASWTPLGDGQHLLALADTGSVVAFDASGAQVGSLSAGALTDQITGVALAPIPGSPAAMAIGGAAGPRNPAVTDIRTIQFSDGGLRVDRHDGDLMVARRDARAVAVEVSEGTGAAGTRIVVVGGTDTGRHIRSIESIDPDDVAAPAILDVPELAAQPTVTAVAARPVALAVVAGGVNDMGEPVADVLGIAVQSDGPTVFSAPPMSSPRSGAGAARMADGRMVVAGGVGIDGAPLATADLVIAPFPGEVAATAALPRPAASPVATQLRDNTILFVDPDGASVYFDPRER